MTLQVRRGWRTLTMTAAALALSTTLAACGGHGSAANSVVPMTGTTAHTGAGPNVTVTNIYGGGSSLAALLYRQWFDYYGVALPPDPQGQGNGLPVNGSFEYYYGSIGSGAGRGSFIAQTPSTTTPGTPPNYCPNGVTTCWPYPLWHFSGSDATLSAAEISCYQAGCAGPVDGYSNIAAAQPARGQYVQIPTLLTAITNAYNPSGQTVPAAGLQLSRPTYCGIWEGAITNWGDPAITADNNGHQVSTQPIIRVVRLDSSGTTFLLTNHLNTACVGLSNPAYDWTGGVGGTVTWPNNTGNVQSASGSGGVVSLTSTTAGGFTYVGPSYVKPIVPTGLPTALLQDNYSFVHNKKAFWAPSIQNTLNALAGVGPPSNTDPYDLALLFPDPTAQRAYPIAGFTWLEAYECYNKGAEANGVKEWVYWYSKQGSHGVLTAADTILEAQGLAPLPSAWKSKVHSIANNIVKGPVASVCTI